MYSSYLKDGAILNEIIDQLIDTMKIAARAARRKDTEIFQRKIFDSASDFEKWFFQDNNNTCDFYSTINIDEFWSQFSMLPTQCFVERLHALRGHIQYGSGIDQMMPEERLFWRDLKVQLETYSRESNAEKKNIWKCVCIENFLKESEDFFKELQD